MEKYNKFFGKDNFLIYIFFLIIISGFLGWIKFSTRVDIEKNVAQKVLKFSSIREDPRYQEIIRIQDLFVKTAKMVKPLSLSIYSLLPAKISEEQFLINKEYSLLSDIFSWWSKFSSFQYELKYNGSGTLINSEGYILTNYHVIKDSKQIIVKFLDGRDFRARLIGRDLKTDLAVLKVYSFQSFKVPKFGDSDKLGIGEWVMAVGNPFRLVGTVTVGVVSGKNNINLGAEEITKSILTDLAINPGNSGGPLANLKGEIIAINSIRETEWGTLGFSKPIKNALKIGKEIIENGKIERNWLGVGVQPLTPVLSKTFNVPLEKTGVIINYLEDNSPAKKGGLVLGDIIINVNGKNVLGLDSLSIIISRLKKKNCLINIFRNGRFIELKILLESKESKLAPNPVDYKITQDLL